MDRTVHLGAYLRLVVRQVPRTRKFHKCVKNESHRNVPAAKFCAECGNPVRTREVEVMEFPTFYDLLEDRGLDERLREVGDDSGKGNAILAISNVGPPNVTEYDVDREREDAVIDLTHDHRGAHMCEAFTRAFRHEIVQLTEHPDVESAEVRFGFIDYWY